jgi:hypothetical protein
LTIEHVRMAPTLSGVQLQLPVTGMQKSPVWIPVGSWSQV